MDIYIYLAELYKEIENEIAFYDDYVSENLIKKTNELYHYIHNAPKDVKEQMVELMLKFIDKKKDRKSTRLNSSHDN